MPRIYIRAPRSDYWLNEEPFRPELSVYERDRTPEWSGLYDSDGTRLYASEAIVPVGFVMLRER